MKTRKLRDKDGDITHVGLSISGRYVRVEHVDGYVMLYTREQSRAVRKAMKRAERELIG